MSIEKKISVIIRTYNNRNLLLQEAIRSVLKQTYKNIEIIVVEDGSQYAKEIVEKIKEETKFNIKYLSIRKAGRCIAGNEGLRISSGDYLVFLDDDDQFYKDHLKILYEAICKHNVLVAYSNSYEVETEFLSMNPLRYAEHNKRIVYNKDFSKISLWKQNYLSIQSVLFSRELYIKCGGFAEDLDALEDWNLWTRFSLYSDFYHCNIVTSMYRVPYEKERMFKRLNEIEKYKNQAIRKQAEMKLYISIADILSICTEVEKQSTFFNKAKSKIRKTLLNDFKNKTLYNTLRKIYYLLSR